MQSAPGVISSWSLPTPRPIRLGRPAAVMAVINCTPDSFSDGGRFTAPEQAIAAAEQAVSDGASWLDIGGESSRPGAEPVSEATELERVVPVVRALRQRCQAVLCVDTCKPAVARAALAAGAFLLTPGLVTDALGFVREHLWDAETRRLSRRYADGDVKGAGFLEDYAFLARGAFDLYGATGDVDHLAFALDLARVVADEFWDPAEETIYFTPDDGEPLVARPQELTDQSTPSSLGVAVGLLADLDHFVSHDEFGDIADAVLATHAAKLSGSPMEHVSLALAAAKRATGSVEVTVAADAMPEEWRERLAETYLPGAVFAPRPATDAKLADWLDTLVAAGELCTSRARQRGATLLPVVASLWPAVAAGATLFLVPVMVFTILLRRHLLRGITFGAVRK